MNKCEIKSEIKKLLKTSTITDENKNLIKILLPTMNLVSLKKILASLKKEDKKMKELDKKIKLAELQISITTNKITNKKNK